MMRPYAGIPLIQRFLQGDSALDSPGDRSEGGHEPVPHRLHLGAAMRLQHLARNELVLAEHRPPALVAKAGHHLGVPDKVGEEHRAEGIVTLARWTTRPHRG